MSAMATTLMSIKTKMEMSRAIPDSVGANRIVLALFICPRCTAPHWFGFKRWPRAVNCTRRGCPVVASGSGDATIKVMATARIFAGELSASAAEQRVGGGRAVVGVSQVYVKIGTGFPLGNTFGYAADS